MKRISLSLLAFVGVFSIASCSSKSATISKPAVTTAAGTTTDSTAAHTEAATYACPMDPEITSTQPRQKCSKCGMDLVKKS